MPECHHAFPLGAFNVTGQNVTDAAVVLHCSVQRVDGRAGHTKRHGYTFFFEHQDCGVDCFHFGHEGLLKTWLNFSQDLCLLEAALRP